jgi:hypothetical protein
MRPGSCPGDDAGRRKRALALLALALVAGGVALAVMALLTGPVAVAPVATATARVETRVVARRETVVVTAWVAPTLTPTRTPTPLPDCGVTLFDGWVCAWPTSTPVLPLPTCGTPEAGQSCVRRGVVRVTMIGLERDDGG